MSIPPEDARIISFMTLRKAVGYLGAGLPFAVWIANIVLTQDPKLQPSVSDFYYTAARNVFVGVLIAIGIFLVAYRGYDRRDVVATNAAGLFTMIVAFVPTEPADGTRKDMILGWVHLGGAALLFLTLAYISIALFRQTSGEKPLSERKLQRNKVFLVAGIVILCSLLLLVVSSLIWGGSRLATFHVVYWLESVALIAFGVSWLTKGQALLGD